MDSPLHHSRALLALLFVFLYLNAPAVRAIKEGPTLQPEEEIILLHYWNFNDAGFLAASHGSGTITSSLAGGSELISSTGQNFFGENARFGDETGAHLRLNNPIGSSLIFHLPTEGHENIIIKYETRRSGSGAGIQQISYTTDGVDFISFTSVNPVDGTPVIATLDFSAIEEVSNNPDFAIRFEFELGGGGSVGNNRVDNLTVEGMEVTPPLELLHYWNFNDAPTFTTPTVTIGEGEISNQLAPTSELISGTGQSFVAANARNGDLAGAHLRLNNPIGSILDFHLPTIGYENVILKYEIRRSTQGAGLQKVSYTINGTDFIFLQNVTITEIPEVITLDFGGIEESANNGNIIIRFEFEPGDGGTGGNDRIDNLTMEGTPADEGGEFDITLISPINNAVGVSLTPELTWNAPTGIVQTYQVQVSTDETFTTSEWDLTGIVTTEIDMETLANETIYFWRVRAEDPLGDWSAIRKFTTLPIAPGEVTLSLPEDASVDVSIKPSFSWVELSGSVTYKLEVSTTSDFSSDILSVSEIAGGQYVFSSQLALGTTYFWHVRASNISGDSPWSEARSFITIVDLPSFALRINEIMASNASFNVDEDGDHSDWIELYNTGDAEISLNGFGLSDNATTPFKWVFPDVSIGPGEFMIVWASNKNRSIAGSPLHTNYAISASGEHLVVTTADGITIDHYDSPPMSADVSYGRFPDGTGSWELSNSPSPASTNVLGEIPITETVQFSHTAGFYQGEFTLSLTTTDSEASIIYTLDGSEPTIANLDGKTYEYKLVYPSNPGDPFGALETESYKSLEYTDAIVLKDRSSDPNKLAQITTVHVKNVYTPPPLKKATVVKARLVKDGFAPGPVISNTYFIGTWNNYTVPVISLSANEDLFFEYTNGIYIPGAAYDGWRTNNPDAATNGFSPANYQRDIEIPAYLEFFESNAGERVINQPIGAKLSGSSSVAFPQKSIRLFARSEYGKGTMDHQLFPDLPFLSYKRLTLRNGGNDNPYTMFRDAAFHTTIRHLHVGSQAYRPSVVFLNGEYWGILNMREHFDKNYLASNYGVDPENVDLVERLDDVKEGDTSHFMELFNYFSQNGGDDDEDIEYIETMMDMDNFTDYQIAEIFNANTDWPGNNFMYWRTRNAYNSLAPAYMDGRIRWLIKDTDFGFGLLQNATHNTLAFATVVGGTDWSNPDWATLFLRELLHNEGYKTKFVNRFADLMNSTFRSERLLGIIDSLGHHIESEIPHHLERWGTPLDWQGNVNIMKDFVSQRPFHQRQHIREQFQLLGDHTLSLDVSDEAHGYIQVNTIAITTGTDGVSENPYPWSGVYFEGVPVTITAISAEGYNFSHWEGANLPAQAEVTVDLSQDMSIKAIFSASPFSFVRTNPLYNASKVSTTPIFSWMPKEEASGYALQISLNENFTDLITDASGIMGTTYSLSQPLEWATTYYWRMRLDGEINADHWSDAWIFKTFLPSPSPYLPSDFAINVPLLPTLQWSDSFTEGKYVVQLSADSEMENLLINDTVTVKEYNIMQPLQFATTYYWRIKDVLQDIDSEWSSIISFRTISSPPVVLVSQGVGNATPVIASWSPIQDTETYEIEISSDPDFGGVIITFTSADSSIVFSGLDPAVVYIVRVRAVYGTVSGEWSEPVSFIFPLPGPELLLPVNGEVNLSMLPELRWGKDDHAEKYFIQLSTQSDFNSQVISFESTTEHILIDDSLDYSTTYFWRVMSFLQDHPALWSETWSFTTHAMVVGLEDNRALMMAYPNPASTRLYLEWKKENDVEEIQMIDLLGRSVYHTFNIDQNRMEIDVNIFPRGMYTVLLKSKKSPLSSLRVILK